MKSAHDKPQRVILWGIESFTSNYMECLHDADFEVTALADNNGGTQFCDLEVLKPSQVKNILLKDPDTVIIPFSGTADNSSHFNKICATIINHWALTDTTVLHPCFILEHLTIDREEKICTAGFDGADNRVLFNTMRDLVPLKSGTKDYRGFFLDALAADHLNNIKEIINGWLCASAMQMASMGEFAVTHDNSVYYCATGDDGFVEIFGIKSLPHILSDPVHQCYELLTPAMINKLEKFNYITFVMLRNPLDIIVSKALKTDMYDVMMSDHGKPGVKKSDIPFITQCGRARLNDDEWFNKTASDIKEYFETYLKIKDHVNSVKYEDLIHLKHIAAESIWNALREWGITSSDILEKLNRIGEGNHSEKLFRGIGIWKKYLTGRHFELLLQHGYDNLLNNLNYAVDWHGKGGLHSHEISVDNELNSFLNRKKTFINIEIPGGIIVSGNSIAMQKPLFHLFSSPFFNTILHSSHYDNNHSGACL